MAWAISGWSVLMFVASLCVSKRAVSSVGRSRSTSCCPFWVPAGVETTTRRALELALANRAIVEPMFLAAVTLSAIRAAWVHASTRATPSPPASIGPAF